MKEINSKLKILLNRQEIRKIYVLTILLLFGLLLEIIALGLLMPVINIFFDENIYNDYLKKINLSTLYNLKYADIKVLLLILVATIYVLKNLYIIYLNYRQNRFISNLNTRLSDFFFKGYLNQPLKYHNKKKVSVILKRMQIDIAHLIALMQNLVIVITEMGLLFSIIIALLIVDTKSTLILFLFFGIVLTLFYPFYKRKSKSYGIDRNYAEEKISKILLESFNGIKELIINGKMQIFKDRLYNINAFKADVNTKHTTLTQTPRNLLEILSISGLVLIIVVLSKTNSNVYIISKLSVYVAAMFRAIPTLNKILGSIQNINYQSPALNNLIQEKEEFISSFKNAQILEFKKDLKFNDVSFSHDQKKILVEINVNIKKNKTYGIVGESGSGKTTLVNLISGLLRPDKGKILIDNSELHENNYISWRSKIGYVPQKVFIFNESLIFNVTFKNQLNSEEFERFQKVISMTQVEKVFRSKKLEFDNIIEENGKDFSGGEIQRIGIARALFRQPELLILDESTASLDSKTEKEIMNNIYKLNGKYTILIISHKKSILYKCHEIFNLKDQKLIYL